MSEQIKIKCENLAILKRYWPGKEPDLVCIYHAEDTKQIAEAMGFHIAFEPIGYQSGSDVPEELPTCCCSAGFSQRVVVD